MSPERISGRRIWKLSTGDRLLGQAIIAAIMVYFLGYDVVNERHWHALADCAVLFWVYRETRILLARRRQR